MKLFSLFFAIFSLSSLSAIETQDRLNIDQIIHHFTLSWNEHAGKGFADHYTEDADFINIFGMAFSGRSEIEERHQKIHETFLKGSIFEVLDVKMREVKPDVVITQVYWEVTKPINDILSKELMKGVFTHTFIKNNDVWEITSTQNTLIGNKQ